MRIALVCPYAWDAPGGVQVHVRQLAERLRAQGHETIVLAPARSPQGEGVVVIGRPVRVHFNGSVAPVCPDLRAVARIRAVVRAFRPEVVHVHEPFAPSLSMLAVLGMRREIGRPALVATFHAYADRSSALAAFSPLLRLVWGRIDERIAVSAAAASFAGRHLGDGFRIVPNGVDVDRFARAEPARRLPVGPKILFVGRLEPRKGFRHAVAALSALSAEMPEAVLVAAGEGPDARAVRDAPAGVRERVLLLGAVPYADLPGYHAACDVFLAPNTGGESFGIVLAEAMAAGLPVVASDIPGFREVVRDGTEGLLVPPGNPSAIAGALRTVLADDALRERLGEAGRRRAGRYRWETVTAQVEAAYAEALRRAGGQQAR